MSSAAETQHAAEPRPYSAAKPRYPCCSTGISTSSKESNDESQIKEKNGKIVHSVTEEGLDATDEKKSSNIASEGHNYGGAYDPLANLPIEFYHYYHGSNNDMGTLIEVRRGWDAFIRPGGSRIPGHWVQLPPPANEIWASYLVRSK